MSSGILLFIHISTLPLIEKVLAHLNSTGRVSDEVLFLYTVIPTRDHIHNMCTVLRLDPGLQHLEKIEKLKPNNSLRDLTAPWRLKYDLYKNFRLVVSLETVTDKFRGKYPIPNLTLQAGSMESGETPLETALRELEEEARIRLDPALIKHSPIGLLGRGMLMYPVYITNDVFIRHEADGSYFLGPTNASMDGGTNVGTAKELSSLEILYV